MISENSQSPRRLLPSHGGASLPFEAAEIEGSLCRRFECVAQRRADKLAIKTPCESVSYEQLNRRANGIAHAILARGWEPGKPAAMLFEQGADAVAAIWGVLKSGNIYVPLDPSYPPARNIQILEDAGAPLLLTNHANAEAAQKLSRPGQTILNTDALGSTPETNPDLAILSDAPAYLIYTSGSSGEPKGVVQTHRNVLFDIRRQGQDLATHVDDRYGLLFAACSSASVCHIFGALLNGAVVLPFDFRREGFARLASWLAEEEISILDINVATFRDLCRILPEGENFPKLRLLAPGSEPVYARDVELYKSRFADSCIMQNALGTTETRTATQYFITKETLVDQSLVPVGRSIPGKDILLLDDDRREASPGEIGEIAVKSRYLSPGYWRKPELTAAVFLPDPEGGDERIYLTGDLGRIQPDGQLVHLGRKDFQVKIRGYRVEVAEVETALATLDGVREAVVAAHEGGDGKVLVAYLVMKPGCAPSIRDLRAGLSKTLPDHEIPARFEFLQALPLTLNGKLDRRALPAPAPIRAISPEEWNEPQGGDEKSVAALFEEVLGLSPIGALDNFFELGGHSLLAARLSMRLETVLGLPISVSDILAAPTPRALAASLNQSAAQWRRRSPVALQRGGARRPLFCIYGSGGYSVDFIKLAHYLGADQPVYVLEHQGIDGREPPQTSIEAMARQYLSEIRTVQPRGPYILCGFSMGGVAAYELARLLHASGERAAFVALIDTYYPNTERRAESKRAAVKRTVRKLLSRRKFQLYLKLAPFASRQRRIQYIKGVNELLARSYQPKFYAGKLIYILADDPEIVDDKRKHLERWTEVAQDVETIEVSGGHYLLGEPHVSKVAAAIREAMDQHAAPSLPSV